MQHVRLRIALTLALVVPAALVTVAQAAAPRVASGSVVLRTTDDAGTCATAPTALRVGRTACPVFRLHYATVARPKALVVVFHGHGHNGYQYAAQLQDMARRFGVVAVAMQTQELKKGLPSYRGPFESVDEEARGAASAIAWARPALPDGGQDVPARRVHGGLGAGLLPRRRHPRRDAATPTRPGSSA